MWLLGVIVALEGGARVGWFDRTILKEEGGCGSWR